MPDLRPVDAGADWDLLLYAAQRVIGRERVNQTWIQRHVRVGFVKAGQLLCLLEDAGLIGPTTSGRGRWHDVLVLVGDRESVLARLQAMALAAGETGRLP
ncbi:DNA translocase FtsK [Actinomadura litoris]|uniref:DNA translocase FtsK n=1 Tax=Actinomadura litoris TaxID=2678616 RepID=UPI001FA719C5|nr:DNA translocase FtsK [Actinomadura litoris]